MPVTFQIATHSAIPFPPPSISISTQEDIIRACQASSPLMAAFEAQRRAQAASENPGNPDGLKVLQGTFSAPRGEAACATDSEERKEEEKEGLDPNLRAEHIGFVNVVLEAYNQHRRLILRPDDVWIAILSQLNLYINANAESLRTHFVPHAGQKELVVGMPGTLQTVDFGGLALQMAERLQDNIVDPTLKHWILPAFSTTTPNDHIICAVMFMSIMQSYFQYILTLCGIPSITLEGTRADWVVLLARIERLPTFGAETEAWARLLRPVLTRFVQTFDFEGGSEGGGGSTENEGGGSTENGDGGARDEEGGGPRNEPTDAPLRKFYSQTVSISSGSGSGETFLSGWITAFCVFDSEGRFQGGAGAPCSGWSQAQDRNRNQSTNDSDNQDTELHIDGIAYPRIPTSSIPIGFAEVARVKVISPASLTSPLTSSSASPPTSTSTSPPSESTPSVSETSPNPEDSRMTTTLCTLAAGHMASRIEGAERDGIRPVGCWFLYRDGREDGLDRAERKEKPGMRPGESAVDHVRYYKPTKPWTTRVYNFISRR